MDKKKDKALTVSWVILILAAVIVVGFVLFCGALYLTGHKITVDRTNDINVMLTRSDNWEKIVVENISLTKEDFQQIDGSTATIPITAELARQFLNASDDELDTIFHHYTTHMAYERLIFNPEVTSLIFATEPSVDELADAEEEGIELEVIPVALDGFVFITHKDNPVESLTVEEIQGIYSGKITNWKQLGGNNEKIIPYQRVSNSGSQTAMEQLVMKDVPMIEPYESYVIETMSGLIERVAEYENRENSIGYTYSYYLNNLYKNENIKVLKIGGTEPAYENYKSGEYPFTTAYYAVIRKDGTSEADVKMRELRDYMLTDEGQAVIEMAGYCPLKR